MMLASAAGPWERTIHIIVRTLASMAAGQAGLALMALGGVLFAFDGEKISIVGWLWPSRKLSLGIVGLGSFLSAAGVWAWVARG